jgi:hypothetical protein
MTDSLMVASNSLSVAWATVFIESLKSHAAAPITISIDCPVDGLPTESVDVRSELDAHLKDQGKAATSVVANTLFPKSLWNPSQSRQELYSKYLTLLPRLHAYQANRKGLYFERLIDFGNGGEFGTGKNQLEHVITTYNGGNHRRSALQAALFDPLSDHSNSPILGFPCLDQVAFLPDNETKELTVTGFYGLQYVVEKAYGNYVGLARLGRFMAKEMGLTLTRVVCVAGSISRGPASKKSMAALIGRAEALVESNPPQVARA